MMDDDISLAEEFLLYWEQNEDDDPSWDKFFDHCNIAEEARNDFLVDTITRQINKINKDK